MDADHKYYRTRKETQNLLKPAARQMFLETLSSVILFYANGSFCGLKGDILVGTKCYFLGWPNHQGKQILGKAPMETYNTLVHST